jgi:hypothetical protein
MLASDDSMMADSSIYMPSASLSGDANASGNMEASHMISSSGMPTPQALTSTNDSHQNILSPIPQIPLTQALQAAVASGTAMDLSSASMDPQTYAQQALRTQQIHLAAQQQASIVNAAAAAGLHPMHTQIDISPSNTPVPFNNTTNASIAPMMLPSGMTSFHTSDQAGMSSTGSNTTSQASQQEISGSNGQAYITPPMSNIAQFARDSGFSDMDMNDLPSNTDGQQSQPRYGLASTPQTKSTGGTTTPVTSAQRMHNPGNLNLDFTTLRGVKEEDSAMTSPFTSSHASMSSFPFTNSGASVTSGSRSRATSISRNTSASRSRAPSGSSTTHPFFAPDAHELETILGGLNTSLPSPIEEDDVEDDDPYYDHDQSYDAPWQNSTNDFLGESLNKSGDLSDSIERFGEPEAYNAAGIASAKDKDTITPEMTKAYNDVFYKWLPAVCGDLEATDRKAEKVHQPLMAKKMAKLDEAHAFRPFKFRIQPFTNAFQDACREAGMCEMNVLPKFVSTHDNSGGSRLMGFPLCRSRSIYGISL